MIFKGRGTPGVTKNRYRTDHKKFTFSKLCFFPLDVLLDCIFGALGGDLGTFKRLHGLSWAPPGSNLAPLGLQ